MMRMTIWLRMSSWWTKKSSCQEVSILSTSYYTCTTLVWHLAMVGSAWVVGATFGCKLSNWGVCSHTRQIIKVVQINILFKSINSSTTFPSVTLAYLSIAPVRQLITEKLPKLARINTTSKDLICKLALSFLNTLSAKANDICNERNKKTVCSDHVLDALYVSQKLSLSFICLSCIENEPWTLHGQDRQPQNDGQKGEWFS